MLLGAEGVSGLLRGVAEDFALRQRLLSGVLALDHMFVDKASEENIQDMLTFPLRPLQPSVQLAHALSCL